MVPGAAVLVLFLVAALPVAAQAPTAAPPARGSRTGVIGSVGMGVGPVGVGGQLSLGAATAVGDFFIRAAGMTEVRVGFARSSLPEHSSADIAILYGPRATMEPNVWVRAAAGPAFVRTEGPGLTSCELYGPCVTEARSMNTVGLAVQLDFLWLTRDWGGWGLGVFGNRNGDRSFWAIVVSLQFGAVR